ncbi:MAG TPA: DUF4124 domain-containing protein [Burkholderiales bacterium]|nr:DUF4124 domain-containing protein [Burkholderiales bacterium]
MKRIFVVAVALAFSAGASAQLYKWKDKDGHIRYGDTPPPGAATSTVRAPAAAPAAEEKPGEAKSEKPLSPEAAFRKRQEERAAAEQKEAKSRADAERKRANCEQARTQLRTLQSGVRMVTVNANGERIVMDDAGRAEQMRAAEKSVADWCQ